MTSPLLARKQAVLEEVERQPGITRRALSRSCSLPSAELTARALAELEAEGLVHQGRSLVTERGGRRRALRGFLPGPGTDSAEGPAPNELRARRLALGLTRRQLADLIGVSSTAVRRWELGDLPFPAVRAAEVWQALAGREPPSEPWREPVFRTDDELDADLVAIVERQPGITVSAAKSLVRGGGTRRRQAAVDRLVAKGVLECRSNPYRRSTSVLYLNGPPATGAGAPPEQTATA